MTWNLINVANFAPRPREGNFRTAIPAARIKQSRRERVRSKSGSSSVNLRQAELRNRRRAIKPRGRVVRLEARLGEFGGAMR